MKENIGVFNIDPMAVVQHANKKGFDANEAYLSTVEPNQMALWVQGVGIKLTPEVLQSITDAGYCYLFGDKIMYLKKDNTTIRLNIKTVEGEQYLDFNTLRSRSLKKVV